MVVGRAKVDDWILKDTIGRDQWVVDVTRAATAYHPQHDYVHVQGGLKHVFEGPDAMHNAELAGDLTWNVDTEAAPFEVTRTSSHTLLPLPSRTRSTNHVHYSHQAIRRHDEVVVRRRLFASFKLQLFHVGFLQLVRAVRRTPTWQLFGWLALACVAAAGCWYQCGGAHARGASSPRRRCGRACPCAARPHPLLQPPERHHR